MSWRRSANNARRPERFAEILRRHESVAMGVEMVVMLLVAFAIGAGRFVDMATTIRGSQSQPWLVFGWR